MGHQDLYDSLRLILKTALETETNKQTICTSNESWKHSKFKFGIKNTICYEKNLQKMSFSKFSFHFWPRWAICISNESWKHSKFEFHIKNTIFYEIFFKKWIFHDFCLSFDEIFFSKLKFFKKFHIQPPKLIPSTCSKHPKMQLHEVWHSQPCHTQNGKSLNDIRADSSAPHFLKG